MLQPASRQQLSDWLIDNETGDACLRAGLGKRWRVVTRPAAMVKTRATTSPSCGPCPAAHRVLTAYLQASAISNEQRAGVLAQVGRIADRLIG